MAKFSIAVNPYYKCSDSESNQESLSISVDVLFAINPAIRLPQTRIRAMAYASDKAGDKFIDMKSLEGPLHRVIEEAYTFIVRNTATVSTFKKGTVKRYDAPLYPEEAIREALINAVAHLGNLIHIVESPLHSSPRKLPRKLPRKSYGCIA